MKQMGKRTGALAAALLLAAILLLVLPTSVTAQPIALRTVPHYTVTFDPGAHGSFDPGGAPSVQDVAHGRDATAPTVKADKAYNFTGWDKAYDNIRADATITAQYKIKTFTVRFNAGKHGALAKGSKAAQTVTYGKGAKAPGIIADEGYDFTGWDKKFDRVTGNLTITARYTLRTITVTFDPGTHGSLAKTSPALLSQQVQYGGKATAPEVTPDEGYTFKGWDSEFSKVTEDITISANYDAIEYTVSVIIQGNGRVTGIRGEYSYGTVIRLPEDASAPEEGYTFAGYKNAEGNAITQLKITKDMTITALFTEKAPAETAPPQATRQIAEEQLPLAVNRTIKDLLSSDTLYFIAGFTVLLLLILFIVFFMRRKREENRPRYDYRFPIYRMLYRKKDEKK